MAGRNISVTHVALGTVRVMRTTGMMGEVVGMAASLCKKYDVTPRGVYRSHLEDLKTLMMALIIASFFIRLFSPLELLFFFPGLLLFFSDLLLVIYLFQCFTK